MLFGGSAKPSFGWYKVTLNIYEATTTKTRLPGAPKLGTSLIIMSSLRRHPDWVGTLIRYIRHNGQTPVKKAKIRYIRYNSKHSLFLKSQKSILNRLGVFRSVRDLEVHKRMRSSDATCCASMAVNTCFFSP